MKIKKTRLVSLRVTPGELVKFHAAAKRQQTTVTEVGRVLFQRWLDAEKANQIPLDLPESKP